MDSADLVTTTAVEARHWWYQERRAIIARQLRRLGPPGQAVEIGAAGGGNCLVLRAHGWQALAVEYLEAGARIARDRGVAALRADARALPVPSGSCDLVLAFDVLEHIEEDYAAAAEMRRVLAPGGTGLVSVPCDMALWSAHDVASGHYRRYDRAGLTALLSTAGLVVEAMWSWNVLLRPLVGLRRTRSRGCDVGEVHPVVNTCLRGVVMAERLLPVGALPGVSLMARVRAPQARLSARPVVVRAGSR